MRFIPVYTGNILALFLADFTQSVYPCVYREHGLDITIEPENSGLSLCIQGTYLMNQQLSVNTRFIPVYTGNMNTKEIELDNNAVYPCVYREHALSLNFRLLLRGLSLYIQGTQFKRHLVVLRMRFIPVYTGNIYRFCPLCHQSSVYPCVYREHIGLVIIRFFKRGLSLCIQGTYRK